MRQGEDQSANSQASVRRLVQLLAEEQKLGSIEIAETLWLALNLESEAVGSSGAAASTPKAPPAPPPVPPSPPVSEPSTPPAKPAPAPRINIATGIPQADVLPTQALPVWIADPAMLSDPLAIIRAIKPLLQQVKAGTGRRLNEPATVDGIARTKLWLPVMEPETEPWFDLVLVVDQASSMQLWQRLIEELVRTLKRYGAFRDVQVYDLAVDVAAGDSSGVRLVAKSARGNRQIGHQPSELIEKRGRRIVMMLSDCAGEYWWNGQLLPMLKDWGQVMPTVVWQLLPEWMWERTALGRGKSVTLSNGEPGAASQRLQPLPMGLDELSDAERKRSPIPVVTSEPDTLHNWSLMLTGDRRELTPGFLLPVAGGVVPKAKSIETLAREQLQRAGMAEDEAAIAAQINAIAQARIQRFLQLSSPAARRLIMLLAAAPVITLPVMRLIRDAMMDAEDFAEMEGFGARSPLPVAEAFVSGLLQRLPDQRLPDQRELQKDETGQQIVQSPQSVSCLGRLDPNLVQYDFVPGVRSLLLKALPEADTVDVINSVSAAVEDRWKAFSKQDFRTVLLDPNAQVPEELAGMRAFASVAASILQQLGGQYGQLAEQLQRGAAGSDRGQVAEPEPEDFEIPPLRIFEFKRAEVREELPPVQLIMDEFTMATVTIEAETTSEQLQEILQRLSEPTRDVEEIPQRIAFCRRALSLTDKENDPATWAALKVELANNLQASLEGDRRQNNEEAIAAYREALEIYQQGADSFKEANTLQLMGNAYQSFNEIETGISLFQRALEIFKEVDDNQGIASILSDLGKACVLLEDYSRATSFYEQSLVVYQRLSESPGIAHTLSCLGEIYFNTGDLERAISLHQESLAIAQEMGDRYGEGNNLMNLGRIYSSQERWAEARHLYERSVQIFHSLGASQEERVLSLMTDLEKLQRGALELVEFDFNVVSNVVATKKGWERQQGSQSAYKYNERLSEGHTLEMVAIPGGDFLMGSPVDEPERYDVEGPQHEVSLEPFFMGRYPVTQAQWRFVAGLAQINRELALDPSEFKGDARPVEKVSWLDAVEFCDRLSAHTGNKYELPTEAQWEYACRAGTTTPFHFGETISPELANYQCQITYNDGPEGKELDETTPVDQFQVANAFGLSEMHGNVWEWCADHWHNNYEDAPADGSAWLTEDENASRVNRGGSWYYSPRYCRSATRRLITPDYRGDGIGFRVSCRAPRTLQRPAS
ncbi:MAG: SAV_2336 N-terminal domain-related protein [Phormidesmis sp.]